MGSRQRELGLDGIVLRGGERRTPFEGPFVDGMDSEMVFIVAIVGGGQVLFQERWKLIVLSFDALPMEFHRNLD